MMNEPDRHQEIRDAVRELCARFPDEYFRAIDAQHAYPEAFYQLQAYGQSYLDGEGDVVLIFPKTAAFDCPVRVFKFPKLDSLRLWVLPFCLESRTLSFADAAPFSNAFHDRTCPSSSKEVEREWW